MAGEIRNVPALPFRSMTEDIGGSIDRLSQALRPNRKVAGWQKWRELLFLHWEVDPSVLEATVPKSLKLDTFEGRAFVGIVPFRMCEIQPTWLPRRLAFNFLETNVRTYVIYGNEPGVYFYSLDANSRLAVFAARLGWSLPYFNSSISSAFSDIESHYQVKRHKSSAALGLRYRVGEFLGPSEPGTLEHFLLERYLLFTMRSNHVLRGHVHHLPYPAHEAQVVSIENSLHHDIGLPPMIGMPDYAHFAPGVDVEVFPLQRVDRI